MSKQPRILSLEDLIGSKIVTADGKTVGHVVDIAVSSDEMKVTHLLYGAAGVLDRINMVSAADQYRPQGAKKVAWDAVADFDGTTVTLNAWADPEAP